MQVRRIALFVVLLGAAFGLVRAQEQQSDRGNELIGLLNQSIDWYHRVQLPGQISNDPADSIYSSYNRNASLQVISLVFDFARAEAQQIQLERPQDATTSDNTQAARNLPQLTAAAQEKVKQASTDLAALQAQTAKATGKKRLTLEDQVAAQNSELELAQARLEVLQSMSAFATAGASAGLLGKINELERTVPEAQAASRSVERSLRPARTEASHTETQATPSASGTTSGTTASGASSNAAENNAASSNAGNAASNSPAAAFSPLGPMPSAAPATVPAKQTGTGILWLAGDLYTLTSKVSALRVASETTARLRSSLDKVRAPLRNQLRDVGQRGDQLSAQPQSSDPAVLADRKKQIDALTADYKHLVAVVLPLAKANILLDASANNLAQWHSEADRAYRAEARSLLFRIGALVLAIIVVMIASDFWRRAIFRYIREQRRRNQFLMLRRFVVGAVIALILIFALSTEIGSLATFAGFLTAGIAVALQNVILSVAAYFFLIGRYGIRVGDRIQIGDVTGDVVDIGLVRLHLVELDTSAGEARPTGRIVVFSNSVVFQPTSNFFKQLPGSNFAWRKISLTLAADVDYGLAEQHISSAVDGVYSTYKAELERQHRVLESSLAVHISSTEPQTRLRLEPTGLEIIILYPVVLTQAAEIDDRMTHALLDSIAAEPRLRLVGGGLTNIKPVDATPHPPAVPAQN